MSTQHSILRPRSYFLRLLAGCVVAWIAFDANSALAAPSGPKSTAIKKVPFTIKKSGSYVLTKDVDLKSATGTAITIAADDITLDLGGFSISNSAASDDSNSSVGIAASGRSGITIRHGTVEGFFVGVTIQSPGIPGRTVVEDLVTRNMGTTGIDIAADRIEVRGCRVLDTGFVTSQVAGNVWGILIVGNSARVEGNEVRGVSGSNLQLRGIQCTLSNDADVRANVVSNSSVAPNSFGIIFFDGIGNFAIDNTITNFDTGLLFTSGTPGKYRDNLTSGCTTAFSGGTAVGDND